MSQWADEYRFLSSEASAEPGKWHTDRAPYQREMMDAVKVLLASYNVPMKVKTK